MGKDKEPVENAAYGAFCVRIVRGLAKRVGAGDPEDLQIIRQLRQEVDQAQVIAITGLLEQGWSYERIGAALGIRRQSVHEAVKKAAGPRPSQPNPKLAATLA